VAQVGHCDQALFPRRVARPLHEPSITPGRVPHSFAFFADEWVPRTASIGKLSNRAALNVERPFLIVHSHQTTLAAPVSAKAAPLPLVGLDHQSALDRVAMHIAQLFDALALAPHVEVVEALLPYRVGSRIPERGLGGGRFAAQVQLTGEALFHDLHDDRGIADFGLGDEQVKVLGHEDVSVNHEAVLAAGLFEDFQEEVAAAGGVELGLAAVTTASDEMQVAGAIITDESLGHAGRVLAANRVWM
jgi:hypothetical protein